LRAGSRADVSEHAARMTAAMRLRCVRIMVDSDVRVKGGPAIRRVKPEQNGSRRV
jgi:hypothetical protein